MKNKIKTLNNLQKIIKSKKKLGKKIVHCHGVFDLLHVGHIKHFKEAKKLGDLVVVTITSDKYVNKGPGRPVFNERLRAEAIAALEYVDYLAINNAPSAVNVIKKIRPNIYCKGPDYKISRNDISGQIKKEIKIVKRFKGNIVFTKDITFSSSSLLNQNQDQSAQHKLLIKNIRSHYTFSNILYSIKNFSKIKVLIIGETIIDQYVFCEALGKSGKEPILVVKDLKTEEYLGGAAALSKHISPFCNKISLLSVLGEKKEYLKKIKKDLPNNIKFNYITKKNSSTILKRRFLEKISKHKLLGVHKINDDLISKKEEKSFNKLLKKLIPQHDLVIVSDYGHGLISKKNAKLICQKSKFLALNAQINSANIGFHSMRNYKNVDCVIINEREIRHELRDKNSILEKLMKKLSTEQAISDLIVTRGDQGAVFFQRKANKFYFSDAYAKSAIDKIGAGDAMLSIIALCLKSKFKKELALLISSLAGAQSVQTIGNKESINKVSLLKSIESILK